MNYRYAQTLLTFYVCWMYSTAIPIMPLICALSCYVSFWIDKFLFCNFYRTPPSYSYNMGKTSTKLIEIAVVVHLVMSLWILGNGMIFTTNRTSEVSRDNALSSEEGKFYLLRLLSQTHLIPLEIILLGYIGLRILSMVSTKSGSILLNCVRCLTCSSGEFVISNLAARTNTVQATYSSAKDRNLIKGLASYNILQNPK